MDGAGGGVVSHSHTYSNCTHVHRAVGMSDNMTATPGASNLNASVCVTVNLLGGGAVSHSHTHSCFVKPVS